MYKITINVDPKEGILDPQGKTVQHALTNLGFSTVSQVRMGKHIVIHVQTSSEKEAKEMGEKMCNDLLFNPLTEQYTISVEPC